MRKVRVINAAALLAAAAGAIEVVYVKSIDTGAWTPYGLSVNNATEVFAAPTGTNERVTVYTSMGSIIRTWHAREVVYENDVDNQGYVYQCEAEGAQSWWPRAIYKYTEEGSFVGSFGQTWFDAAGVASDDGGYLYVTTRFYQVFKVTTGSSLVTSWGEQGSGPGQFDAAKGVRVGPDGNVYVTEWGNNKRVQYFTPTGSYLGQFGVPGSGNGGLSYPFDIDFNAAGDRAHIADTYNSMVQYFRAYESITPTSWGTIKALYR